MDWLDILEHIKEGEDERTELKRGLGNLRSIARAIAAFANTEGGLVVVGVDDDGTIIGVREDPESASERLTSFLQSGLSAPVQAKLGRHQDPQGWVHWVEVPHQRGYEPLRHEGRVYVRRGRASVEPSPAELQDLYNLFGYILTEERAIDAAGVEAIDVQTFQAYLNRLGLDPTNAPQPDLESDLRNRGVVAEIGGQLRATLYGVLAFGKTPQSYPQTESFWVECVAYGGTDRADQVLQVAEAKGTIDQQVWRAVGWLKGLGRKESYRSLQREDEPLLPEEVVRETLVNAVVHRDYAITGSKVLLEVFQDRVVVTSPGTLPNAVTPESVRAGGHARSRNESLANYMVAVGMMEQRGRGWPIIRRRMIEHNRIEPDLQECEEPRSVRVILWLRSSLDETKTTA